MPEMPRMRLFAIALTLLTVACTGDATSLVEPNVTPRTVGTASIATLDANFQQIDFSNASNVGAGAGVGFNYRYPSVITIIGQPVDAVVTVKAFSGTLDPRIASVDSTTSITAALTKSLWTDIVWPSGEGTGAMALEVAFYLGGTDTPVILQNVAVTGVDIDSREYVESTNVTAARVAATTNLVLIDKGNSTVRAEETAAAMVFSTNQAHWVEFRYDAISKVQLTYGALIGRSQAFFFANFIPAVWTIPTEDIPADPNTKLIIKADNQSVGFGAAAPTYTYTFTDLNGNAVSTPAGLTGLSCAAPYTAGTTGIGTQVITCSGASASGFTFTYATGTLTITTAPLVVVADDKSIVFNDAAPSYTYTLQDGNGNTVSAPAGFTVPSCTAPYTAGTTGAGTANITCSGAAASNYAVTYQTGTLTITKFKAVTTYTGTSGVTTLANLPLSATVSPAFCTGTATYSIAPNPTTGTGTLAIASGVSTIGWIPGVYEITATHPESANCASASEVGFLILASPGDATTGGGQYTGSTSAQNNLRVHFGYTVQSTSKADRKTNQTTITQRGNLLWMVKEGWRLKGSVVSTTVRTTSTGAYASGDQEAFSVYTCPAGVGTATSKPKCGQFVGTGVLQRWNPSTSAWETASQLGNSGTVSFTATIYDGGSVSTCRGKTCTITDVADSFGLALQGISKTDGVPVGAPAEVRRAQNGSIHIR